MTFEEIVTAAVEKQIDLSVEKYFNGYTEGVSISEMIHKVMEERLKAREDEIKALADKAIQDHLERAEISARSYVSFRTCKA